MVMVTKRLAKDLTGVDEILAVFTPPEMGGVAEVDFTDMAATEAAMVKTGQLLREELIQNVRAYSTFHDANQLDLSKLAADLGVDPKFMREALHSQSNRNSFYDNLTCSLDPVALSMNRWTKVRLTIGNDSDTGLTSLLVRISGPAEIRPQRLKIESGRGLARRW